jgi:hypothetical protein
MHVAVRAMMAHHEEAIRRRHSTHLLFHHTNSRLQYSLLFIIHGCDVTQRFKNCFDVDSIRGIATVMFQDESSSGSNDKVGTQLTCLSLEDGKLATTNKGFHVIPTIGPSKRRRSTASDGPGLVGTLGGIHQQCGIHISSSRQMLSCPFLNPHALQGFGRVTEANENDSAVDSSMMMIIIIIIIILEGG